MILPMAPKRPVGVTLAVVGGVALAVAIDFIRVGGPPPWLTGGPTDQPVPPYEARGRVVQVDGRGVYLDCRGTGSPTVILEAGFGSGAGGWGATFDGIAAFTRVCAWDRPGLGRSESRGRHSAGGAADDLRAALAAAGERGPYVVVAHSLGGVYARIFGEGPGAPGDVVAYLMLDTYDPDIGMADDPAVPAAIRETIRRSLAETSVMLEQGEELDWARTLEELAAAGPADLRTMRISADPRGRWTDPDPAVAELLLDAWYRAVERTYPNSTFEVATGSGHLIPFDRPDLVIDRARELVELARSGSLEPTP